MPTHAFTCCFSSEELAPFFSQADNSKELTFYPRELVLQHLLMFCPRDSSIMLTFKKLYELGPATQSCFKKTNNFTKDNRHPEEMTSPPPAAPVVMEMKEELLLLLLSLSQTGAGSKERRRPVSVTGRSQSRPTLVEGPARSRPQQSLH